MNIRDLGNDVRNSLTAPESNLVDTGQVLAGSGFARRNVERGSFVVTGTGGLPVDPFRLVSGYQPLAAPPPVTPAPQTQQQSTGDRVSPSPTEYKWQPGEPIVEANAIVKTPDGRVLLSTIPKEIPDASSSFCEKEQ